MAQPSVSASLHLTKNHSLQISFQFNNLTTRIKNTVTRRNKHAQTNIKNMHKG